MASSSQKGIGLRCADIAGIMSVVMALLLAHASFAVRSACCLMDNIESSFH
jgi:hypothetical protein